METVIVTANEAGAIDVANSLGTFIPGVIVIVLACAVAIVWTVWRWAKKPENH